MLEHVVYEESIELELHGNILHKPLLYPYSNETEINISKSSGQHPTFQKDSSEESFVAISVSSNENSVIKNASLFGTLRDEEEENEDVMLLPNLNFMTRTKQPNLTSIVISLDRLHNFSKNYDLELEIQNGIGSSRFPIKLDLDKQDVKDQDIILLILLPSALGVVLIALVSLVVMAYRYRNLMTYDVCSLLRISLNRVLS